MAQKHIIFRCLFDNSDSSLVLNANDIHKVFPVIDKNGKEHLWVDYYDDDMCCVTSCICDKVERVEL